MVTVYTHSFANKKAALYKNKPGTLPIELRALVAHLPCLAYGNTALRNLTSDAHESERWPRMVESNNRCQGESLMPYRLANPRIYIMYNSIHFNKPGWNSLQRH